MYQFTRDGRVEKQESSSNGSSSAGFTGSNYGSVATSSACADTDGTETTDDTNNSVATETLDTEPPLPRFVQGTDRASAKNDGTIGDVPLYAQALASAGWSQIACWLSLLFISSMGQFMPSEITHALFLSSRYND